MLAKLERDVEAAGGDEAVFARIEAGERVGAIMRSYGLSRGMFYRWVKVGGDARRARYQEARRYSADALAEDGREILDRLAKAAKTRDVSNAEVSLANSRANYRKYLASVYDREQYGERPGVQVNIGIRDLHLDALRTLGGAAVGPDDMRSLAPAGSAAPSVVEPAVEAQVIELPRARSEMDEVLAALGVE